MTVLIYNIAVALYTLGIKIYALFNAKAAKWIEGRKGWQDVVRHSLVPGEQRIWVHCSSLGEFEQGKPVLEALRTRYPKHSIVLTFFSPSGYEAYGKQTIADHVFYLPADTKANAQKFITLVDPQLTIFVKYEFWYHYLHALAQQRRVTLLISATFRPGQAFFKWYGGFFRKMLGCFTRIFVQDAPSVTLLAKAGFADRVILGGDTRYDRVAAIAASVQPVDAVTVFADGCKILVAGSTWPSDEAALQKFSRLMPKGWKLIIVPHEIHEAHISKLKDQFINDGILFSALKADATGIDKRVLIVDNMGMLARLYAYATLAYVGGGLDKGGVHNVLEPAAYGIPIVIGPVYQKYVEACEMVEAALAVVVTDGATLVDTLLKMVTADTDTTEFKERLHEFMQRHMGSTDRIMISVVQDLLPDSI